jgi:hypothetical protein
VLWTWLPRPRVHPNAKGGLTIPPSTGDCAAFYHYLRRSRPGTAPLDHGWSGHTAEYGSPHAVIESFCKNLGAETRDLAGMFLCPPVNMVACELSRWPSKLLKHPFGTAACIFILLLNTVSVLHLWCSVYWVGISASMDKASLKRPTLGKQSRLFCLIPSTQIRHTPFRV